jgi:hypothetical protein
MTVREAARIGPEALRNLHSTFTRSAPDEFYTGYGAIRRNRLCSVKGCTGTRTGVPHATVVVAVLLPRRSISRNL